MVCVVLPTLPEMSQNLATGATRFFPNPATILHGGQLCPTGRLAIRSEAAGGRLLCSPPSVKINISRWGRTCCTRDTEARLASSAKGSALRVGYPEDLRLESFKLPRGISRSKQGGDGAHRETKVVGNLVKRVLAESTTSVAKLLAKSTIELFGRKLERVGGARNSEVAGAKVAANVVHKSGRSLEANEPDIGEAGIGAEAGDNSEVLDDLRKRVDKSKPELGRSTLNCGGENIMDRVAVMLETRAVDEVLSEPDNQAAQDAGGNDAAPAKDGHSGPGAWLDGASGEGTALIYVAEKSTQHLQSVLENRELKLPDGTRLVGTSEEGNVVNIQGFDVDAYFAELSALQCGNLVLFSSRLPSTHTILSQNFRALPLGTVCVADVQYQGKGRGGNVWESPKGCLMFSLTLQLEDGRTLPFLQYVVSLGVVEGFEVYCSKQGLVCPDVRIKWPNDLYAKGLKVGGVLCTSTYSCKKFNLVVGVGLNVRNRQPTTCLEALLEEVNSVSHGINRERLLACVLSRLEELLGTFTRQGFGPLEASYYGRWLHSGQKVELEERTEGETPAVSVVPITIQALTSSGFLLATDEKGDEYELHPDGNSFDFLRGLVRKKLAS